MNLLNLENTNMNKEFIPYEQALELKELGFNESCFFIYSRDGNALNRLDEPQNSQELYERTIQPNTYVVAPLYQQAFRWFREKEGYHIDLFVDDDKTFGFCITYFTYTARVDNPIQRSFNTYEEAELACLKKLIEIVSSKK